MVGLRELRATAVAVGALGGLSSACLALLLEQSRRARILIGVPEAPPPCADVVYAADGTVPLRFAVLGDSMSAGVGVNRTEELPGVRLAIGLAEETGRPVALRTYAVSGSTTPDLHAQVDEVLVDPPDVALVIIGANDVTTRMSISRSAALLAYQVRRLRSADIGVVVGTCPDLGVVRPIPQPLRFLARAWSLRLARTQREAVRRADGCPVGLGDILSPEFMARPNDLFSPDRFHPSAAGYEAAAAVLLAPLCEVLRDGGLLAMMERTVVNYAAEHRCGETKEFR
jgi:lysophospholipase L1-like esterase